MTIVSIIGLWPPFGGDVVPTIISGPYRIAAADTFTAGQERSDVWTAGMVEAECCVAGAQAFEVQP